MIINKTKNHKLEQSIRQACLRLLKYDPAMGYFLMRIPIIIKDHKIPTFFTNGKWITVPNNDSVNEMTEKMPVHNILQHEALHIIFEHVRRKKLQGERKDADMRLQAAMIAEEYLVNENLEFYHQDLIHHQSLEASGRMKLKPRDDLVKMRYEDLTDYFLKVLPKDKSGGKLKAVVHSGDGFGKHYDQHTIPGDADADAQEALDEEVKDGGYANHDDLIKGMVKEAAMKAKAAGKKAGQGKGSFWNEVYDELFSARIDWRNVLQKHMKNFRQEQDESGQRQLHRRYHVLSRQVRTLPFWSYRKPVLDGVWMAIDTSGSVSDDEYIRMVSDALSIVREQKVTGKILLFSSGVEKEFDINEGFEKLKEGLKNRTYGGTDLREVYDRAEKEKAQLLMVFSDLYAHYPERKDWPFASIFLTEEDEHPEEAEEFGEVIKLDRDSNGKI